MELTTAHVPQTTSLLNDFRVELTNQHMTLHHKLSQFR